MLKFSQFRLVGSLLFFIVSFYVTTFSIENPNAFVEDLSVTLSTETIAQGEKITITAGKTDTSVLEKFTKDNLKIEPDSSHSVSEYDSDAKSFSINGNVGDATLKFIYTDENRIEHTGTKTIKVQVSVDENSIILTDVLTNKTIDFGSEVKLLSGNSKSLSIKAKDKSGAELPGFSAFFSSSNPDLLKFNNSATSPIKISGNEQVSLTAQNTSSEQTAQITVKSDTFSKDFTIRVFPKIEAKSIVLTDGNNKNLSSENNNLPIILKGAPVFFNLKIDGLMPDKAPGAKVSAITGNSNLVDAEISNNSLKLIPHSLPTEKISVENLSTKVTIKVTQADDSIVSKDIDVQLQQQSKYILVKENNPIILVKDGVQKATAEVHNTDDGSEIKNANVTWSFVKSADDKWITLAAQGKTATIIWKDAESTAARPASIDIQVTTTDGNGALLPPLIVTIKMVTVVEFSKLKVKMNVMDKRTVRDLFGKITENEYYVVSVRMYNNLKNEKTDEYLGASILVYNGSFEVAVRLQKQYDKNSDSGNLQDNKANNNTSYQNDGKWYDVAPDDFYSIQAYPKSLHYIDHRFIDEKGNPVKNLPVVEYGEEPPDPPCQGTITYRPLTFEMAINTVDARDARRNRSRIFTALSLLGSAGSFLSTTNVLTGNSVAPVLDRFSNLLIPGLEKVFPSLKEVHRQNIVSMTMKPIEEIPFGTDLTRIVLIPKKSIRGVLQDHKVRISQICPYYFKVEVAVIKRGDKTEVQQGTRTP